MILEVLRNMGRGFLCFLIVVQGIFGIEISSKVDLNDRGRGPVNSVNPVYGNNGRFPTFYQPRLDNDLVTIKIMMNKNHLHTKDLTKCTNCICNVNVLSSTDERNLESPNAVIEIIARDSGKRFSVEDIPVIDGTRDYQNNDWKYHHYFIGPARPEMTEYLAFYENRDKYYSSRENTRPVVVDDKIEAPLSRGAT